jgi:hypothetical protein
MALQTNQSLVLLQAAPQKKADGDGQEGTEVPLPPSFKPALVGETVTDVAAWLKNKPVEVDLDGKFFGVLDKKAASEKDEFGNEKGNKIVLCRIGGRDGQDDNIVQCVLVSAEESTLTLGGMEYGDFDGLIERGEYVPEV